MQLYNNVMNSLRSLFVLTNDAIYCTLRYDVLMACHEANIRAVSWLAGQTGLAYAAVVTEKTRLLTDKL